MFSRPAVYQNLSIIRESTASRAARFISAIKLRDEQLGWNRRSGVGMASSGRQSHSELDHFDAFVWVDERGQERGLGRCERVIARGLAGSRARVTPRPTIRSIRQSASSSFRAHALEFIIRIVIARQMRALAPVSSRRLTCVE